MNETQTGKRNSLETLQSFKTRRLHAFARGFSNLLGLTLAAWSILPLAGCKSTSGSQQSDINAMAAEGGREYRVSGRDYIKLDPKWAAAHPHPEKRRQEAERIAALRRMANGMFLNNYLNDKEAEDEDFGYGGFNAEVRFSKDTNPNLERDKKDPTKYWFDFNFVIGGYEDLIGRIKNDKYQQDKTGLGPNQFVYAAAVLDLATLSRNKPGKEWFREEDWFAWNPDNNPKKAVVYNITLNIVPQPLEPDAFLPIDQLIVKEADGSRHIPVAVHFGWDGESQGADIPEGGVRYDIELARSLFKKLIKLGFLPPTPSFETYRPFDPQSSPFKKQILIRGKPVSVDVYVYTAGQTKAMEPEPGSVPETGTRTRTGFEAKPAISLTAPPTTPFRPIPGPDPETREGSILARQQMLHSLAHKKVVMYLGHSGLGMGFNFGDWGVPEVDDQGTVFAKVLGKTPLLDSFQIVIADGCQTYYLAENFLQNPTKRNPNDPTKFRNLNLVTSLGFTDADSTRTVTQFLKLLTRQRHGQAVVPRVSELLTRYNPDGVPFSTYMKMWKNNKNNKNAKNDDDDDDDPLFPVYGMHGIESNPRSNPLADRAAFGKPCQSIGSCGNGDGNICLKDKGPALKAAADASAGPTSVTGSCTLNCIDDQGCRNLKGGNAICKRAPRLKLGTQKLGICIPNNHVEVY